MTHNLGRVLTNRTLGIVRSEIQQVRARPLHPLGCTPPYTPVHTLRTRDHRSARPVKAASNLLYPSTHHSHTTHLIPQARDHLAAGQPLSRLLVPPPDR